MTNRDKDMLVEHMENTLNRLDAERDLMDKLQAVDYARGPSVDSLDLSDDERELLEDLGQDLSSEDGEFFDNLDAEDAFERVRESYEDVLSIEHERGEPFCVALTIGGPNIYLVDMGGFGGPQLWGAWGERHTITGSRVDRHVEYFREYAEECLG